MVCINKIKNEDVYNRRWWIFLILVLAILIVVIDHTILNVALPTLQRELGATVSQLQWMVDAYILAFATLLLTMGTLGDRIGRATILRIGMILFGLASLYATLAGSALQVVTARVFMGAGAAMIMPATLAIITHIFPSQERGKAIGLWGAMNGIGVAIGPLLGGLLLDHFQWSAIFFINIPILVTALVAGGFLIPDSRDPSPQRLDLIGTGLSAVTIWLLVFGFIKGSDWGWIHPIVLGVFTGFIIGTFLFLLREKQTDSPMLDLPLFNNARLSAASCCIAIMTVAMFGMLFALTMYMQCVKAYTAMQTGLRFLPLAFGYAFGSVSSNRWVRLWETRPVVTAGFLGMAVLAGICSFWQVGTPFWQIGVLLFLFSYCMGNIMTPSLNAVLGAVPKTRAGAGSAIGNVSFQIGGALGVAALGSLLTTVYRSHMESSFVSLGALGPNVAVLAKESVGAAVTVANILPQGARQQLIELSGAAFIIGWQSILLLISGIGILGAFFSFKFLPAKSSET